MSKIHISKKEEESVKFAIHDDKSTPGPGYYETGQDDIGMTGITASDGPSWSRAERTLELEDKNKSPGPQKYDGLPLDRVGKGLSHSFPKAKRFSDADKKDGVGFYTVNKKIQQVTSEYGNLGLAERKTLETKGGAPGPKYNTRPTWRKGTKNSSMGKAERWPVPEEEESPGPIYYPHYREVGLGSKGLKFSTTNRFKYSRNDDPGHASPGPITATSDIVGTGKRAAPKFSIAGKLKSWEPGFQSCSPGCKYQPKDTYVRKSAPTFSFGPPVDNNGQAMQTTNKSGQKKQKPKAATPTASSGDKPKPAPRAASAMDGSTKWEDGEEKKPVQKKVTSARKQQQMKEALQESLLQARSFARNTPLYGLDSPGPAHYGNIYKLFENQPQTKSATMAGRIAVKPVVDTSLTSPGPAAYGDSAKYHQKRGQPPPKTGTFGKSKRETVQINVDSPGPIYNNETWTKRTPIRHGVATQTTNYRAKAQARAKAVLEAKAKQNLKYQLAKLQEDYPSMEDDYLQQRAELEDLPAQRDKSLVNVWY
eukprot:TRINITY_DN9455_c0_g1_i1.p1 TRINITY_DN9455_c0_g1~~TRINITY_DN9455_c0_g1_i1.p1  ORF type:complete len:536 (-),score=53.45 TRINITY_DN9455_c0_g1_i1:116-1723(-)